MKHPIATMSLSIAAAFTVGALAPIPSAATPVGGPEKHVNYWETYHEDQMAYVEFSDGEVERLPACAAEDGRNCFWLAEVAGNGDGRSFADLDGVAYYLS